MGINVDMEEVVIDPYKQKQTYKNWDKKINSISADNEKIIVKYLDDMRNGINLNPRATKGKRGYHRLNNQKHRLKRISELLEQHYKIYNIAPKKKEELKEIEFSLRYLFEKMEEGGIVKKDGKRYTSIRDYIKGIKAFWHWYMVYMKREHEILIPDVTEYLTIKEDRKPQFVYFGHKGGMNAEEGFKKLLNAAKPEYKPLMAVLFDSGIRVTEFLNIKSKDIADIKGTPYLLLTIREETSKTFGREIKLMLSYELLRNYLTENTFKSDDFIFPVNASVTNQYIKRLGERVLGKKGITMYDFRHNSACYWLPRYKSESALMYRFGWKDSKMIHYYTELMGMKDTIQEDDLMIDVTKSDLQKALDNEKKQRQLVEERMKALEKSHIKIEEWKKEIKKELLAEALQMVRREVT
ncbi:MAG TPA: tyrosine-type recombinase/integrase [Candidatus Nanoarchaeia archaeon]|nr:tyrosine-type recombinase/integrase [Candidatus Nanoarchaeia archaeon]